MQINLNLEILRMWWKFNRSSFKTIKFNETINLVIQLLFTFNIIVFASFIYQKQKCSKFDNSCISTVYEAHSQHCPNLFGFSQFYTNYPIFQLSQITAMSSFPSIAYRHIKFSIPAVCKIVILIYFNFRYFIQKLVNFGHSLISLKKSKSK